MGYLACPSWKGLLYVDNDSKFKVIRHGNSRSFDYKEETLAGETTTEIHRALLELGIVLPHEPENARAKGETPLEMLLAIGSSLTGKIERVFRFIQERFTLPRRVYSRAYCYPSLVKDGHPVSEVD